NSIRPAQQIRRINCSRLYRLHRSQAELHHHRKLASVQSVWVNSRVGAERYLHPSLECASDVLPRRRHYYFRLLDHEFGHTQSLIVFDEPISEVEGRDEISSFLFHQENRFIVDERAVYNGLDS